MQVGDDYFLLRSSSLLFYTDVSASFAELQAEKLAADNVLQEMTPVQGCQDAVGLHNYLQNTQLKVEVRSHASYYPNLAHMDQMLQDDVSRLTGKLTRAKCLHARSAMSLKCI